MGRPVVTTVTLAAAVANGIAQSQSKGAAGTLTLNGSLVSGGVATLDSGGAGRRVIITSAADDSGITFTVTGTGKQPGNPSSTVAQSEVVTGANTGIATTQQDFVTVTSIANSAATAGAVTAGTSGTGSGPWVPWDANSLTGFEVACVGNVLSGGPVWQVDVTFDDVFLTGLPSNITYPRAFPWPALQGKAGDAFDCINKPGVRASRLTLTAVGSVQLTQTQQGT